MIAYLLAVFLLGVVLGAVVGGTYVLREADRRQREAFKRMKAMRGQ